MKKRNIDNSPLGIAISKIKAAAIFGFISAGLTALVAIASHFGVGILQNMGFSLISLIDALLVAWLAVGVLARRRVFAILLFAVFCLSQIVGLINSPIEYGSAAARASGAFIWGGVYARGIVGAFDYHKILRGQPSIPPYGMYQNAQSQHYQTLPPYSPSYDAPHNQNVHYYQHHNQNMQCCQHPANGQYEQHFEQPPHNQNAPHFQYPPHNQHMQHHQHSADGQNAQHFEQPPLS